MVILDNYYDRKYKTAEHTSDCSYVFLDARRRSIVTRGVRTRATVSSDNVTLLIRHLEGSQRTVRFWFRVPNENARPHVTRSDLALRQVSNSEKWIRSDP